MSEPRHEPVLATEVVELLAPVNGGLFVDCTVGLGGHTRALLDAGATKVLGLDRDQQALDIARAALARFGDRVELVHADYRDLERVLDERSIDAVNGTLADLGVSSMQLDGTGAASASGAMNRSTCGWTGRAAKRPRTFCGPQRKTTSRTRFFNSAKSGTHGASRGPS